ncbi:MAG: 3-isopropylmalate dehydratase [Deltaproteobacteria bacterium]|nr:MAG: 3-isopropylmalate dehydratase [Deltaproteobacteria bacterium]
MARIWKFGDDVNTDEIIPGRFNVTTDPKELAAHCFFEVRPEFSKEAKEGDIIIAGKNFGMGSSREHAPISIKAAGIKAVIASSFARIFFRNGINIGLPLYIIEGIENEVEDGETVELNLDKGLLFLTEKKKEFKLPSFPPFVEKIIKAGGVVELLKRYELDDLI